MSEWLPEGIGKILEVDSQGRIPLGAEYARKENWFLFYDLAFKGSFVICPESSEGEGFLRAYNKPLTFDSKGRCYIPVQFRDKFSKALLLKRENHFVVLFNQTSNV